MASSVLATRHHHFDVERAVFMTVLHRVMVSGSDRSALQWRRGQAIDGAAELELQHLYRAMGWLGEALAEPEPDAPSPRRTKDLIKEELFARRRDLFTDVDLVFFDTNSQFFTGEGGETLGQYGKSKDRCSDCKQMVLGMVIDGDGVPVCSEMWQGNAADVATLDRVAERLQRRFGVRRVCVVADAGMISMKMIAANRNERIAFRLASGNVGVMAATNEEVEASQFPILAYVYGAVIVLCLLSFRSISATVCIIVPLAVVSLLAYALMALLQIGLKVSTLPVVALGVGIGVDYGIYIYGRLRTHLEQGLDFAAAYERTLATTGAGVVLTGLTLAAGVATWIVAPLKFQADMGTVLTFMFLVNMVGAVVLLPALGAWLVRPRKAQGS